MFCHRSWIKVFFFNSFISCFFLLSIIHIYVVNGSITFIDLKLLSSITELWNSVDLKTWPEIDLVNFSTQLHIIESNKATNNIIPQSLAHYAHVPEFVQFLKNSANNNTLIEHAWFSSIEVTHTNMTLLLYDDFVSNFYIYINVICFVIVLLYLTVKLAAAPFHFWSLDIYSGTPFFTFFYLQILPKIVLLFMLITFMYVYFSAFNPIWNFVLTILSVCSISVGALGAVFQLKIKRFFIYSTINNLGFLLLTLTNFFFNDLVTFLFYALFYFSTMLGLMLIFTNLQSINSKNEILDWIALTNLRTQHPALCFILTTFLFSLGGIPPLVGFFNKFLIYSTLTTLDEIFIFVVSLSSTIVSIFYYFRIIKLLYFTKTNNYIFYKPFSKKITLLISSIFLFQFVLIFNSYTILIFVERVALTFLL